MSSAQLPELLVGQDLDLLVFVFDEVCRHAASWHLKCQCGFPPLSLYGKQASLSQTHQKMLCMRNSLQLAAAVQAQHDLCSPGQ